MAQKIGLKDARQKAFAEEFQTLCVTKSPWDVWADFVTCASIAISNALCPDKSKEHEYLEIIGTYGSKAHILAALFGITVNALEENPEQDFLGDLFMRLNMGDHWKGQFFTPYNIAGMMADITIDSTVGEIENRGWGSVNDPACGAGAMLIAARNALSRKGFGSNDVLFIAQDIDRVTALMCYIQLSLLGCAGYVIIEDSLSHPAVSAADSPLEIVQMPEQDIWIMPALSDDVWKWRRLLTQIERVIK